MKLLVVASSPLRPYLERLESAGSLNADVVYLPADALVESVDIQPYLSQAKGYDAIVFADGAQVVGQDGLTAGEIPVVLPRVHNAISLLLGDASCYRALSLRACDRICWWVPAHTQPVCMIPAGDASWLCYLADTQLGLPEDNIAARQYAQANGLDYCSAKTDLHLLSALLSGEWDRPDVLVAAPHTTVTLTYQSDLME